jgi:hypothetical protein
LVKVHRCATVFLAQLVKIDLGGLVSIFAAKSIEVGAAKTTGAKAMVERAAILVFRNPNDEKKSILLRLVSISLRKQPSFC